MFVPFALTSSDIRSFIKSIKLYVSSHFQQWLCFHTIGDEKTCMHSEIFTLIIILVISDEGQKRLTAWVWCLAWRNDNRTRARGACASPVAVKRRWPIPAHFPLFHNACRAREGFLCMCNERTTWSAWTWVFRCQYRVCGGSWVGKWRVRFFRLRLMCNLASQFLLNCLQIWALLSESCTFYDQLCVLRRLSRCLSHARAHTRATHTHTCAVWQVFRPGGGSRLFLCARETEKRQSRVRCDAISSLSFELLRRACETKRPQKYHRPNHKRWRRHTHRERQTRKKLMTTWSNLDGIYWIESNTKRLCHARSC